MAWARKKKKKREEKKYLRRKKPWRGKKKMLLGKKRERKPYIDRSKRPWEKKTRFTRKGKRKAALRRADADERGKKELQGGKGGGKMVVGCQRGKKNSNQSPERGEKKGKKKGKQDFAVLLFPKGKGEGDITLKGKEKTVFRNHGKKRKKNKKNGKSKD